MLGWDGKSEPKLSSLSGGINVLYLLIWSSFKIKRSLSRVDGSEEEVSKKVIAINLVFYKKIDDQI